MNRVILAFAAPAIIAMAACQPAAADKAEPPAPPSAPTAPEAPAAPQPPEAPSGIPAEFQGHWIADLSACATSQHDSNLVVEAERVTFWESSGEVKSVKVDGRKLNIVVAMEGEGETWDGDYTFQLSEDGKTLTDVTEGQPFARKRCP